MDSKSPTPPPTTPSARRDPCWSCGYDLTDLTTSTCPECGAHFPTGKDLETLHDRLLGGVSRRCISCGARRTEAGLTRCPTCGMRYSRGAEEATSPPERGARVAGTVQASHSTSGTRRRRLSSRAVIAIVIAGEFLGVLLVLVARRYEDSLPESAQSIMKITGVVLAGVLLAWLVIHLVRRDVRSQVAKGEGVWSHRTIGSCPNCGYDMRGLPTRKCPECGFDVPEDEREQRLQGS